MKKRKKKPELRCHCGCGTVVRPAKDVYKDVINGDEFLITCSRYPVCDSYVGVHKGTLLPKGTLANGDLRHWRILAHRAFDCIWQNKVMTRTNAYGWIRDKFCLKEKQGHIGYFTEYMCMQLIGECTKVLGNNGLKLPESIIHDELFIRLAS